MDVACKEGKVTKRPSRKVRRVARVQRLFCAPLEVTVAKLLVIPVSVCIVINGSLLLLLVMLTLEMIILLLHCSAILW